MALVDFDTHAQVKRLTSAGFDEAQAEALTSLVTDARQSGLADLATKTDLAVVKSDLTAVRTDLAVVKADLEARIARTEGEIIKWAAGLIGFQTLAILGAVVALVRFLHAGGPP